jgi:hypothetical protein
MSDKCMYAVHNRNGYYTMWTTQCGNRVKCEAPEEIGLSFTPLSTADGKRYCEYCGRIKYIIKS